VSSTLGSEVERRFAKIVANIGHLGLKKPVTVSRVRGTHGEERYELVCGQGRLEAYIAHGQTEIPAILVEGSREDLLLMSLAENLARRQHSSIELVRAISVLKDRGYSHAEIARKIDLDSVYVKGILQLLAKGEERLLQAVEKGQLPLYIAITIATSDDKAVQRVLQEAYEKNDLRGKSLQRARRLIESRRTRGKKQHGGPHRSTDISSEELLRTFKNESLKQRMVIQKAKIWETRLLFATSALRQLFQDEHFVTILQAEHLVTLPQFLAEQLAKRKE